MLRNRHTTGRKIAVGGVAAATALGLTLLTTSPGMADARPENGPKEDSEALGQLIESDLLGAQLADVASAYSSSPTSTDEESTPLDVEALSALKIDLGNGLSLPLVSGPGGAGLLDLGEVGALNSYGHAPSYDSSKASAGAIGEDGALNLDPDNPGNFGNAKVNLTDLLNQLNVDSLSDQIIDELSLELGALGSTAEGTDADVTSKYVVADAKFNLSSPLVKGVSGDLDTALGGVGDTVDSAVGTDGALGMVLSDLDIDLSVLPGLGLNISSGDIGVDGLDAALKGLSDEIVKTPLEDGDPTVEGDEIVSIDLSTGKVTVNVANAAGENGLNGLDPNTQLLNDTTLNNISAALTKAIGTLTTKITDGVTEVLNNTDVTLNLSAKLSALVYNTNADIKVETTLGQLAGTDTDTDPTVTVIADDSGALSSILGFLGLDLNELTTKLVTPLLEELVDTLSTTLGGVIEGIGTDLAKNLDGIIEPVVTGLDGVFENLNLVADVTINEQPTKKDPVQKSEVDGDNGPGFTVNAVSLELLNGLTTTQAPGDVADINLASSSVRATADEPEVPGDDDANTNAAASAAASADADDDSNASAEVAAQAAAQADATTDETAAADASAEAAAESAATEDASSETTADATTETNASATVAAEAASNADNTDAANADTNAAADADPAAAASVASNADSSSEASAAAAADADDSAVADASNESDVNANASASAAASADADNNDNAIAEAAAQAAATADADTTASAAADIDASAAAESAATEDSSSEASADATSDPNASAQAAATAAANADDSETANADTTAAADADPAAAASAASNADSSAAASAEAASSADADGAEAEASASADADPEASASAEADADPEGAATAAADGAEAEATASADADGAEASASSDDDADKASASADSDQAASANAGASSDSESSASSSSQSNASASSAGASTNASGSSDGGDLPRTGADGVLTMASIAALLIAGGAAAIYGTRRYRASAGQH